MSGHLRIVIDDVRRGEIGGAIEVDLAATIRGKQAARLRGIATQSVGRIHGEDDFADLGEPTPSNAVVRPGAGRTPVGTVKGYYDNAMFKHLIGRVDYDFGSDETADSAYFCFGFERQSGRFSAVEVETDHMPREAAR
jgi:hypothetical protein